MQSLLAAIRRACPATLWSEAVELVREGAVSVERSADDEVVLRVQVVGRAVSPTAVLYLVDEEWSCDCGGRDPCVHVAAAAIALNQARQQGVTLRSSTASHGHLAYRLARSEGALRVERFVVHPDGREEALEKPLATVLAGASGRTAVLATHDDLRVDWSLDAGAHGLAAARQSAALLEALSGLGDLRFEGQPVRISSERVLPRATVLDHPAGVLLRLDRDPVVTDVVADGVVLCGDTLRPLGETELTGERLEKPRCCRGSPGSCPWTCRRVVCPSAGTASIPGLCWSSACASTCSRSCRCWCTASLPRPASTASVWCR